jgi:uncharacterized RDD family membrane protein YckC
VSDLSLPGSPGALVAESIRIPHPDRRFYAYAADRLIAASVDAAVAFAAFRLLWERGDHLLAALVVVATVLLVGLVFAVLLGTTGSTPGKALLGLRVVHTGSGAPIGVGRAVLRTITVALAALPFGLGLPVLAWTCLVDPTRLRRGWHDYLVSSIVLDSRRDQVTEEVAVPAPPPVVNLTTAALAPARHSTERPELES